MSVTHLHVSNETAWVCEFTQRSAREIHGLTLMLSAQIRFHFSILQPVLNYFNTLTHNQTSSGSGPPFPPNDPDGEPDPPDDFGDQSSSETSSTDDVSASLNLLQPSARVRTLRSWDAHRQAVT